MRELPELRTLHSKTYDIGDGKRRVVVQQGMHYHDRDTGQLEQYRGIIGKDDRAAQTGYEYRCKGQHWSRFGRHGNWRIGFGPGRHVSFAPQAVQQCKPKLDGGSITYPGLWQSADLRLSVRPEGVKEDIVLDGPDAPIEYVFSMHSVGVKARQEGQVILLTADDAVIARIPAPTVVDAEGNEGNVSVSLRGHTITLTVNVDWLSAPDRAWPATVDPSVTLQPGPGKDTFIHKDDPADNYGTETYLQLRCRDKFEKHVLVETTGFDTYVGKPITVTTGTLSLNAYNIANTSTIALPAQLYRCSTSWASSSATWNTMANNKGSTVYDTITFTTDSDLGFHAWDVTSLLQHWADATYTHYGFYLYPNSTGTNAVVDFRSGDYGTTSQRPKLEFIYTLPTPSMTYPTGSQVAPSTANNDVTPTLTWTYGGTQSKYQTQVLDEEGTVIYDSGEVTSTGANDAMVTGDGLGYDTLYRARVRCYESGLTWSDYATPTWMQFGITAPTGLAATGASSAAEVQLSWTSSSAEILSGYNLYRRLASAGTSAYEAINLSILDTTSHDDETAASGTTYTYAVSAIATDETESPLSTGVSGSVTFVGSWIGDSQIYLRRPPRFTRGRRSSKRLDLDGHYQVQDRGWAPQEVDLDIRFSNTTGRDAVYDLFSTSAAATYRDDRGNVLRGKVTSIAEEEIYMTGSGLYGGVMLSLTEVSTE